MDLMDLRRRLMMGMANGVKAETITIPNNVITNTSDVDAYFSELVTGWDSEIILLFKKDLTSYVANRFVWCWSAYACSNTVSNSFTTIGRMNANIIQSVTRNDWVINLNPGDQYYVVRFGTIGRQ